MQQPSHSHSWDHLGLVAGMFDELGIGDVIARATQQHPETRMVTVGNAVKAMVLNGLGFVHQPLYWVPMVFHKKPTSRLLAPSIDAQPLNDDTLGRSLETLDDDGVTAFYRLVATTAAQRLG
jgi:transposase